MINMQSNPPVKSESLHLTHSPPSYIPSVFGSLLFRTSPLSLFLLYFSFSHSYFKVFWFRYPSLLSLLDASVVFGNDWREDQMLFTLKNWDESVKRFRPKRPFLHSLDFTNWESLGRQGNWQICRLGSLWEKKLVSCPRYTFGGFHP